MIGLGFTAVVELAKGAPCRKWRQIYAAAISKCVKSTVNKVKQRYQMNEISATNGFYGTVSHKT